MTRPRALFCAVGFSLLLLAAGVVPCSASGGKAPRANLFPRLRAGQSLRYQISSSVETRGKTESLVVDPEASGSSSVKVEGLLRVEVLEANPRGTKALLRLRTRFEKLDSDTHLSIPGPNALPGTEGRRKLEDKAIEFVLAPDGEVSELKGLDGFYPEQQRAWLEWFGQFVAAASFPEGGVRLGQKWESEQAERNAALAGLVWQRKSEYVRNESCRPVNLTLPGQIEVKQKPETCAAILTTAVLRQKSPPRDPTPEEYRLHDLRTSGSIRGALEVITYVSLDTGFVVRSTATSKQELDVTIAKEDRTNEVHYTSSVKTQSQVRLVAETLLAKP